MVHKKTRRPEKRRLLDEMEQEALDDCAGIPH